MITNYKSYQGKEQGSVRDITGNQPELLLTIENLVSKATFRTGRKSLQGLWRDGRLGQGSLEPDTGARRQSPHTCPHLDPAQAGARWQPTDPGRCSMEKGRRSEGPTSRTSVIFESYKAPVGAGRQGWAMESSSPVGSQHSLSPGQTSDPLSLQSSNRTPHEMG